MAFTGNYICNSFKKQLFEGVHTFGPGGDQFKLALYTNGATLNENTTAYTSSNEVTATGTYVAGGGSLVSAVPTISSDTLLVSFVDLSFTGVTFEPYGALIYNSSVAGNPACFVLDFDGPKQALGETFTIVFPPFTLTQAFVRAG